MIIVPSTQYTGRIVNRVVAFHSLHLAATRQIPL